MFMLRQGHDSAPGLDIMLLKQQYLGVSGQAANPVRQHPPVEYVYRISHPMLQFLNQKLAEWIAICKHYAEELNVPLRPDLSQPWSTATLNRILQTCLLSIDGNQPLENDRARFAGTLRFRRGRSQPTVACCMDLNIGRKEINYWGIV